MPVIFKRFVGSDAKQYKSDLVNILSDSSVPQVTRWLNRVALASGVGRLLEENLTADHSRPTCVEGATLHASIENIPSVDFVRVCPYATLGSLQIAKYSAPIQHSPFPGHCSQTLFFLFPIPTSLFFINLIFFNLFSSRLCMKYQRLNVKQTTINKSIPSAHPIGIKQKILRCGILVFE